MQNNRRIGIIAGIVVCLSIVGLLALTFIPRINKVPVVIQTIPTDATIAIDNKTLKPGTVYLEPGEVPYSASSEGFTGKEGTIYVSNEENTIFISLNPVSDAAYEWMNTNRTAISEFETNSGSEAARSGEAFRNNNPIVNKLPYSTALFAIGYVTNQSDPTGNSIILTITAPEQYRQDAIDYINTLGYAPGDFTYRFTNERNPFTL